MKSLTYYFHMKTKILAISQISISATLCISNFLTGINVLQTGKIEISWTHSYCSLSYKCVNEQKRQNLKNAKTKGVLIEEKPYISRRYVTETWQVRFYLFCLLNKNRLSLFLGHVTCSCFKTSKLKLKIC